LVSCSRQDENQEAEEILRPVRTVKVEAPNLRRVRELSAVVDAARKVDLSFSVSGEIVELLIKPGAKVK
jgi:multidrug efflux pump subunit AcrA (membrane-fusion protein)